jgi:hypothetical protein
MANTRVHRTHPSLVLLLGAFWLSNSICAASSWSERGPALGGRLSAIVVVPATSGAVLLVASPGGGVWRSVNAGSTWTLPANTGLGDYSVAHLEWDIVRPGRLFALTFNALYATTNNADSWTALINSGASPAPLQPPDQTAITDPKPFAQMRFSATQRAVFASLPCSGLHYSFDGATFTQHWPFPGGSGNFDNCIGTIAADAVSGRVYFSTLARNPTDAAHVFRSNCGAGKWGPGSPCLTWQPAHTGLPSNAAMATMVSVSTPGGGDHLVAQTKGVGSSTSTYLTLDGLSWKLQSTRPNTWDPRTLIYTGYGQELFEGNVVASHSADFGVNWTLFQAPSQHPDTRGIYSDTALGKVWTVTDGSESGNYANVTRWNWTPGNAPTGGIDLGHSGLTVWQAYFAGVVPTTAGPASARRVFLGSQDNASLCSDSLGQPQPPTSRLQGWTASGAPPGGSSGDQFAFQLAPSDPNRAYAWSGETQTFARTLNAASAVNCAAVSWAVVTPTHNPPNKELVPPIHWSRHAMAVSPADPNRLYFALSNDIGESVNAGSPNVLVTHHPLVGNYNSTAIYVDASRGGIFETIYVGTADHGAYRSTDDGRSWSPWGLNTNSPALISAIASSGGSTPTFWMASTSGLYKGQAGGTSWTLSTGGTGYIVSDVAVDPTCPTRVYAAFGFGGPRAQHRGGIQMTSDNGATWTSITSGFDIHQGPVTAVEVDRLMPAQVYAASYGRGFWLFNWQSNLPACKASP